MPSCWPKKPVNTSVAIDVQAILTRLFPIKIVESTISYRSESASALSMAFFRFPKAAIAFNLTLLSDEYAVSADEKNALKSTSTAITIINGADSPSISDYSFITL